METAPQGLLPSPQPSPAPSPVPSPRGFRKVLSNRSRTSLPDPSSDTRPSALSDPAAAAAAAPPPPPTSTTTTRAASPKNLSRNSSRDDSSKSGSSRIRKLIPSQTRRKRRRLREKAGLLQVQAQPQAQPESESTGTDSTATSTNTNTNPNPNANLDPNTNAPAPGSRNHSATNLLQDDASSLLTDDSEPSSARPPLVSHNSHTGYLTHSSPLINTTALGDGNPVAPDHEEPILPDRETASSPAHSTPNIPSVTHSSSLPATNSTPALSSTTLLGRSNTLAPPSASGFGQRKSISSSIRGISPTRKLRKALQSGRSSKGPTTSPHRDSLRGRGSDVEIADVSANDDRPQAQTTSRASSPTLIGTPTDPSNRWKISSPHLPSPITKDRPTTPPSAGSDAPVTTVTPPTPVDSRAPTPKLPTRAPEPSTVRNEASGIFVSPSGNMISHRRIRSDSASLHHPSKLSNAVSAPLTPTIEEARTPSVKSESRNVTPSSGFFASWVSVAQNAANTITNTLNNQNRSRSGTETTEPEKPIPEESGPTLTGPAAVEPDLSKKQLAVETLGAGDLKLSHLGIGMESKQNVLAGPDPLGARNDVTIQRDEAAAKVEDMLAKRAVSAAYERPPEDSSRTPVAELSDPINALRHTSTFNGNVPSDMQTTPNGSVVEGDLGSVKRNNSVRSRLKDRRHRGSSNAAPGSAVGTLLAASSSSLANPAVGPRLTGFAVAPRARNRSFHQLFRSVPEDDLLIEDYSCALQKEILVAGRIYISEGHICFSSNILGWVTTLVISFEEVMAIERETTAVVFPNAIAVQTLHARHLFRSLLSREATFDLIVGIWKQSHPAAFKKSIASTQAPDETDEKADKPVGSESDSNAGSDDEESYDEDDEEAAASSLVEAGSFVGSDVGDGAPLVVRKASAINAGAAGSVLTSSHAADDGQATEKALVAAAAVTADFPGPNGHAPTDCTDSATHYDKPLKDESIPAPLGKIYSMLFGPTSGVFLTKYLVDEQKVTELQYEDDKKGLGDQVKSRTYSYIKPLYASIGPKQTKCITTENLDVFDLERSVSVTCTTQTPDVPSGNVFSVKTRYCLSWAAGNATRLQMNCTVEWTGKSWLKGPIEKGATDGQQTYGNDLVKALKAAVSSRPRAATAGSKGLKAGKRRAKGEKNSNTSPKSLVVNRAHEHWGLLEPFRGTFGPIVIIFRPFAWTMAVGTIVMLLGIIWFRRSAPGSAGVVGYPGYPSFARLAAYEELWQAEESDLWSWLEDRVGVDGLAFRDDLKHHSRQASSQAAKAKAKERQQILDSRNVEARLREESMTEREMGDAIRITQERLDVLKGVLEKKKMGRMGGLGAREDSG